MRGVVSRLQLILSLLRVPLAVTLGGTDRERCTLACAVAMVSNSINQLADVYNLAVTSRSRNNIALRIKHEGKLSDD